MKKILLVLLFGLFLIQPIFAESRIGSTITAYSESILIKRGDWKVFRITYVATANGGNFVIHDTLTAGGRLDSNAKSEGSEATSLNGKPLDFTNKPLEGSTGLYLAITNATVIVEYE